MVSVQPARSGWVWTGAAYEFEVFFADFLDSGDEVLKLAHDPLLDAALVPFLRSDRRESVASVRPLN